MKINKINILFKHYLLLLMLLFITLLSYYEYQNLYNLPLNIQNVINKNNLNKRGYLLDVFPKESFKSVLNRLRDDNIISIPSQYSLYFISKIAGYDRQIKAGEYLITDQTTPRQLIAKLVDGKVELHKFSIIEGLRFEQSLHALNNHPAINHTLNQFSCKDILKSINRTKDDSINECEGLFMPDTYLFAKNTKDTVILQKAYDAMQYRLNSLWNSNTASKGVLQSSYEALIMASIIEKETSLAEEMKRVSGVYHRRLKIGIPLQADPTVIYGFKAFDRPLTRIDLKGKSKYNTYVNKGLPPSPIATPSVAAIFAALNPAEEEHLYFVADGSGGHIFSASLLEHNKAVWTIRNGKYNSNNDYPTNR